MNLTDYRVGLVMTRSGLNPQQLLFFRHHLQTIARMIGGPVTLSVPVVISHGHQVAGPDALNVTERTLEPIRLFGGEWLKVKVLPDAVDIDDIVQDLRDHDEVWCATTQGAGSERYMRPGFVYQRAQTIREAPRFKMLHYWVELDPKLLPTQETKKGKKRPALKGY